MGRKKLDSVRKVYAQHEKQLTHELVELRERRAEQQAQARHLKEMLAHYRAMHRERSTISAGDVALLSSFYRKVSGAVEAQDQFVAQLEMAYESKQREWRGAYRQRRAMDVVLDKAQARERLSARRKDRRDGARPAGPGSWTILNDEG